MDNKARSPIAVLSDPIVVALSADLPIAVLLALLPLPRPIVTPLTRISLHEKLAITFAIVVHE